MFSRPKYKMPNGFTVWIVAIVFYAFINRIESAYLRCYTGSNLNSYITTPLENPLLLLNSSCIDQSRPTIIYTFGYRGKVSGPATTAVLNAYLSTQKRNLILLDWENEAGSSTWSIRLGYAFYAVPNAKTVGNQLGMALVKLVKNGLNMTDLHLVAHSLGAHLVGYAGRTTREYGLVLPRITGLDPAGALFDSFPVIFSSLDRRCARYVDIIHTDPGGYGTIIPRGTTDFWPNFIDERSTQPGCSVGNFEMFSAQDLCSHDRSWRFLVESVSSPTAFPSRAAGDYDHWVADTEARRAPFTTFMGELTNINVKGNFYLTTNAKPPFGKGTQGLIPNYNQVRRRRSIGLLAQILQIFS